MEKEIMKIRNRMRRCLPKVKEQNPLEFMQFLLANYDDNHKYKKLNKDIARKLKEEEVVEAFLNSSGNFQAFTGLMASTSGTQLSQKIAKSQSPGSKLGTNLNSRSGPSLHNTVSGSNFFALTQSKIPNEKLKFLDQPIVGGLQSPSDPSSPGPSPRISFSKSPAPDKLKLLNSPSGQSIEENEEYDSEDIDSQNYESED